MQEIEQYEIAWHRQNGPCFRYKLTGAPQWTAWITVSALDFLCVTQLLKEKPVYVNPQTGYFFTGAEPTGC